MVVGENLEKLLYSKVQGASSAAQEGFSVWKLLLPLRDGYQTPQGRVLGFLDATWLLPFGGRHKWSGLGGGPGEGRAGDGVCVVGVRCAVGRLREGTAADRGWEHV